MKCRDCVFWSGESNAFCQISRDFGVNGVCTCNPERLAKLREQDSGFDELVRAVESIEEYLARTNEAARTPCKSIASVLISLDCILKLTRNAIARAKGGG